MLTLLRKARSLHGRMDFQGLKISIENRRGSLRQWYDPHNKESGTTRMKHPYGYIKMTEGNDGDHVDCYVGPHRDAKNAYVVHQMKAPHFKTFDEDKCMLGFLSAYEARAAYLAHYNDKRFLGSITIMPMEKFKAKVLATKDKPGKLKKSVEGIFLVKSRIKGHTRRLKSGKVSTVREHEDSRKKKAKTSIAPWLMTKKQFNNKYMQHNILRKDVSVKDVVAGIKADGFSTGIGPQVVSPTTGKPQTIIEKRFGTIKGRPVIAIPDKYTKDSPNGRKVKPGWKFEGGVIVVPEYDYQPLHEAVIKQALSEGKTVPEEILKDYPKLNKA